MAQVELEKIHWNLGQALESLESDSGGDKDGMPKGGMPKGGSILMRKDRTSIRA